MSSPIKRFLFIKRSITLKKSQLDLFDWQPSHEEMRARAAHQRRLQNGTLVSVKATQARVKVRDGEGRHPKPGEKVYYRTVGMDRKKKGTVVGGNHEEGWKIQPVRGGYTFKPPKVVANRDEIWTQEEHAAQPDPKKQPSTAEASVQRQQEGAAKIGMSEADVLKHPQFTRQMKATLKHLAGSNGFNPNYTEHNGVLHNDDMDASELYSEYVTAAMGAFRSSASKATPEDAAEFNNHLAGVSTQSNIMASMHRSGKTAALRHLIKNNNRQQEEHSYDTSMEDDMESGMRQVTADAVADVASRQTGSDKVALETGVMQQLKRLDDPVAEAIIKMKFGLGRFDHGYKNQDIAAALNRTKVPHGDGGTWDAGKVQERMTSALAALGRTKGVKELLGFLKSMRELEDLRKSTPLQQKFNKATELLERYLLVKSHIKEYTRQDGTVVQAHDDKRQKHNHIAMHELDHGEHVHTGAELKHGKELADHLGSKGWKHKEVPAIRRNESLKVGDKKDMPKPAEVKGANKENSALVSAQNVINKMHENAGKHSDPVAYLKHVTTSRSNPYLKAADDYRTALLKHFGHEVDHDTKDHRYEKDGHVVTLSEKDGKHTVEHAGYEEKDNGGEAINPSKDTMAQAIAKLGGLNSAEAKKQFDLTSKDFPAIRGTLKKDGLDPDKMAELLAGHGYIRKDDNGKHDYDDFQDKLRRTATGEKVFSQERDSKDVEAELKKQEQEYIDSMDLGDVEQAAGYQDLHEEAKKAYASVYEEAVNTIGKEATNKLVQMHQHDVPFGVKEYVDAQLRRAIDEHTGSGKQGNDSGTGKQDAAGRSGQVASKRGADDVGKTAGTTAGKPAGSGGISSRERPRSGADADAVTFSSLKAAVAKHDPDYWYTDSIKSPDYQAGKKTAADIIDIAKILYKTDPDRTMQALAGTGIMEHQIKEPTRPAPPKANPQGGTVQLAGHSVAQSRLQQAVNEGHPEKIRRAVEAAKRAGETDSELYRHAESKVMHKSVNHVAYIRRMHSGTIVNVAEKGSPRARHLEENHGQARQFVARMWRHGAEESDIIAGLRKQYGLKEAHAAEMLQDHKRNKGM